MGLPARKAESASASAAVEAEGSSSMREVCETVRRAVSLVSWVKNWEGANR